MSGVLLRELVHVRTASGPAEIRREEQGRVVTVMADARVESVRKAIGKGDITWRAVWDGERGPIATRWNVQRFPTVYVIDRRGVIRARDADGLAELVAGLLKGDG